MLRIHILSGTVKIIKLPQSIYRSTEPKPMCEICKNNDSRTYTHSRNPHHRKLLLQLFKQKKLDYEKQYPFLL